MACCQVPTIPKEGGNGSYPVVCLMVNAARIFFPIGGAWFSISVGTLSAWTMRTISTICNRFYFLLIFAFWNNVIPVIMQQGGIYLCWLQNIHLNKKIFLFNMCKCVSETLSKLNFSANLIKVSSTYFVRLAQRGIWLCLSSPVGGEGKYVERTFLNRSSSIALLWRILLSILYMI